MDTLQYGESCHLQCFPGYHVPSLSNEGHAGEISCDSSGLSTTMDDIALLRCVPSRARTCGDINADGTNVEFTCPNGGTLRENPHDNYCDTGITRELQNTCEISECCDMSGDDVRCNLKNPDGEYVDFITSKIDPSLLTYANATIGSPDDQNSCGYISNKDVPNDPNNFTLLNNQTCYLQCLDGYFASRLDGVGITCISGNLAGGTDVCQPIRCRQPRDAQGYIIQETNLNVPTFSVDVHVTLRMDIILLMTADLKQRYVKGIRVNIHFLVAQLKVM